MLKRILMPAAAAALLLLVATQASGRPTAGKQCSANPNSSLHWNAVFGHATSTWQATLLRRRVQAAGFRGVQLRKDYCDDVELEVVGVDTTADRKSFAKKVVSAGFQASFEPPDILKRSQPGIVKAVFGTRPTVARAATLQLDMARVGFREGSDIERLGLHSWRVVIYNIPVESRDSFAAEARSVGYSITFLPQ
jgi:hypothetical protein